MTKTVRLALSILALTLSLAAHAQSANHSDWSLPGFKIAVQVQCVGNGLIEDRLCEAFQDELARSPRCDAAR